MTLIELGYTTTLSRLLVLTVSRLSRLQAELSKSLTSALDDLDLTCRYYEQHYAQDIRSAAHWMDAFGGVPRFAELNAELAKRSQSASLMVVGPEQGDADESAGFREARVSPSAEAAWSRLSAESLPDAVVWVHAMSTSDDETAAHIRSARNLLATLRAEEPDSCGFVVTSCRGTPRMLEGPFETDVCESEIRLPLWVDLNDDRPRREQTLSGSFDLLPLVGYILNADMSGPPNGDVRPAPVLIRGDRFLAARSVDALAVRSQTSDAQESGQPDTIRLYLKPEDVWNVHDQAGVYLDLRDELSAVLKGG